MAPHPNTADHAMAYALALDLRDSAAVGERAPLRSGAEKHYAHDERLPTLA